MQQWTRSACTWSSELPNAPSSFAQSMQAQTHSPSPTMVMFHSTRARPTSWGHENHFQCSCALGIPERIHCSYSGKDKINLLQSATGWPTSGGKGTFAWACSSMAVEDDLRWHCLGPAIHLCVCHLCGAGSQQADPVVREFSGQTHTKLVLKNNQMFFY